MQPVLLQHTRQCQGQLPGLRQHDQAGHLLSAKEGMYLSDEKGHIYHDRFGTPAKINLWDYPALNNKNRIVIGPSGSGKSFWLNNYILQSYELGRDMMIIDIGGSYRSMIALNRGKYFDSTEQKKFAFNPFLCDRDKNGKYLYIDTTDAESADDQIKPSSPLSATFGRYVNPCCLPRTPFSGNPSSDFMTM